MSWSKDDGVFPVPRRGCGLRTRNTPASSARPRPGPSCRPPRGDLRAEARWGPALRRSRACRRVRSGPGEPAAGRIPVMGICMGCQVLGLAPAAPPTSSSSAMGHQPVRNLRTGIAETAQNHGFAPLAARQRGRVRTSTRTTTPRGLARRLRGAVPSASPGPHDAVYLFDDFYKLIRDQQQARWRLSALSVSELSASRPERASGGSGCSARSATSRPTGRRQLVLHAQGRWRPAQGRDVRTVGSFTPKDGDEILSAGASICTPGATSRSS